jgi:hypothetical protein
MQTITAVPVVSDWLAGMLLGETAPADLSLFAPDRFSSDGGETIE